MVEIGSVRTNQFHFEAGQTALTMCLFKLRPTLPKYTVFGYERLHPWVQSRCCHLPPVHKLSNRLPIISRLLTPGYYLSRFAQALASLGQQRFCNAATVAVMIVERGKQLLVCGHVPLGKPLQMANK